MRPNRNRRDWDAPPRAAGYPSFGSRGWRRRAAPEGQKAGTGSNWTRLDEPEQEAPLDSQAELRRRLSQQERRVIVGTVASRRFARFTCAAALTLLGLWIAREFLLPLTWAIVIAVSA